MSKYFFTLIAFIIIVGSVFWVISNQTDSPTAPDPSPTMTTVNVYLVALEGTHQSEETIGCNDALVPVVRTVEANQAPLAFALQQLLGTSQQTITADNQALYNAFSQSDVQLASATIENGTAVVDLTGELRMGGVCDQPRIKEQLWSTIGQFEGVNDVEVTLNGQPFEDFLSNR